MALTSGRWTVKESFLWTWPRKMPWWDFSKGKSKNKVRNRSVTLLIPPLQCCNLSVLLRHVNDNHYIMRQVYVIIRIHCLINRFFLFFFIQKHLLNIHWFLLLSCVVLLFFLFYCIVNWIFFKFWTGPKQASWTCHIGH